MTFRLQKKAVYTAKYLGNEVTELLDVGVAGLHRLLGNLETIFDAKVIIAIAGMEGAIASVVGGLADCPVIAVPTSVGYGASFGGLSALLSMLNSCASGVSVVNIDNGFGAAYQASMIIICRNKIIKEFLEIFYSRSEDYYETIISGFRNGSGGRYAYCRIIGTMSPQGWDYQKA